MRSMMKDTLKDFNEWYDAIPKDYIFDFRKAILECCESDVEILHKSCKIFCKHFKSLSATSKNPDGIDPFLSCLTLPSACNLLFRTNFLKPNQITLIPQDGYHNPKRHSAKRVSGCILTMNFCVSEEFLSPQFKRNLNKDPKFKMVVNIHPK